MPVIEYEEETSCNGIDCEKVAHAIMFPLLFGGDQLSVARQRTALKVMSNAQTSTKRLEGLIPTVEDWHANCK